MVLRGFPNPAWPIGGFNPSGGAGPSAGGDASFRVLTTCSWEQSDAMVKVYVPLRGVQTEMLRATFTPNSVEARNFLSHHCDHECEAKGADVLLLVAEQHHCQGLRTPVRRADQHAGR